MSRWKMFVRIFVYLGFMFLRIKAEKKGPRMFLLCPFSVFTSKHNNFKHLVLILQLHCADRKLLSFGEKVLLMTGQDVNTNDVFLRL